MSWWEIFGANSIFLLDESDDDNDGDGSNNYNNRSLAPIMGESDKC